MCFEQVAAGADHFAACTADGDVFVWGANTCGQLGITEPPKFDPRTGRSMAFTELTRAQPRVLVSGGERERWDDAESNYVNYLRCHGCGLPISRAFRGGGSHGGLMVSLTM